MNEANEASVLIARGGIGGSNGCGAAGVSIGQMESTAAADYRALQKVRDEQHLRTTCVDYAVRTGVEPASVVETAQQFYDFITNSERK